MFDAPTGDLPLLLTLAEDEWHEILVDLDSVEPGKTDKGWSCYMADINGNNEEIPFWAMKPFYDFCIALPKKQQSRMTEIRYRRTLTDKKNEAEFKES